MARDFFPLQAKTGGSVEDVHIFLVDGPVLSEGLSWVSGCEHCSEYALIRFDYILDALTGADPTTEYIMCRPPRCPRCRLRITEKTRVVLC